MDRILKIIVVLCGILFAKQANADMNYGFPGIRDENIQRVTVTRFAPQERTVTLKEPDAVKAFVDHIGVWGMDKRMSKTFDRDFFNRFPVRYRVTVQNSAHTYTVYLGIMNSTRQVTRDGPYSEPWLSFFGFLRNENGSFTMFLEGPSRSYNAPDTPFEEYLTQLFPPFSTIADDPVVTTKVNPEREPAWFARSLTLPVWLIVAVTSAFAATVYLALVALWRTKTGNAEQAAAPNGP